MVIHFYRVFAGCEIDSKKRVADGEDVGVFAIDFYFPAFAVRDGGEHDAVFRSGNGALEVSVAVLRDVPLTLSQCGNGGVQSVVIHLGNKDIAAACGRGVDGNAHLCAFRESAHIYDVRLIGSDVPVGAADLYVEG